MGDKLRNKDIPPHIHVVLRRPLYVMQSIDLEHEIMMFLETKQTKRWKKIKEKSVTVKSSEEWVSLVY